MESTEERFGEKRKRGVSSRDYSTQCICCNPKCDDAMKYLQQVDPNRCAYFELPSEPKPESEIKSRLKPEAKIKRKMKIQRRSRMLKALPDAATQWVNDKRYSSTAHFKIASLHFHDDIYNLCTRSSKGTITLVEEVPASLIASLKRHEYLEFTESDRYDNGAYVPLPNIPEGLDIKDENHNQWRGNIRTH